MGKEKKMKEEKIDYALMKDDFTGYRRLVKIISVHEDFVHASIWRPGHNSFRERGGNPKSHWTIVYKCKNMSLDRNKDHIRQFISRLPKDGQPVL